jgi:cytidyltransferase-like protein
MKKVFVSGCYDILHAGHLQFFKEARALGDHLTVSFASTDVLWNHKQRRPSLPDEHKKSLLEGMSMVDHVVIGNCDELGLDFVDEFRSLQPDILAVTRDDQYEAIKRALCNEIGTEYHILEKTEPDFEPISTTDIVRFIRAPMKAPVRVDFAGGWLDVPKHSRPDGYVVNCAVSPLVSLRDWPYERCAGMGGSGAYAMLQGSDGVAAELDLGVGWQDPAVIFETGLCIWRSGRRPALEFKRDGEMLAGRMAIYWTGQAHDTPGLTDTERDYDRIFTASKIAREAVLTNDRTKLAAAVQQSYQVQLAEGMQALPEVQDSLACKYCGGGWGGYAVYLFEHPEARDTFLAEPDASAIEPYFGQRCARCGEKRTKQEFEGLPTCEKCEVEIRAEREEKLPCPMCSTPMDKSIVLNIILDKCPTCHGAWLEAGELDLLKEAIDAGAGSEFATGMVIGMAVG